VTDPHSHTARLESALAGRCKIERKLGEGGMATVYLAEDLKHERKVALKILRPELAAVIGAERFLAEIKTTANLQHPHILPLFDSGEADSFLYYVMPYVEGETLRDKLEREQQLGVDEAVRIASDVADALDYAHRHDVIHRDIKPANILLHDGRPVVADFGIALAISAAGGGRMTETGMSLGTPHYMSPEQASADRELSGRSDVYSLGCVVYEMLAGQPPHTGPTAQSILVRILTEDPRPITDARRSVPPNVAAAVMKAIEKLPADRFASAADFMEALADEGFRYTSAAADVGATTSARDRATGSAPSSGWVGENRSRGALATIVILLGFVFALASGRLGQGGPSIGAVPFQVVLDERQGQSFFNLAVGPDGSTVRTTQEGLSIRRPGSPVWEDLGGTAGVFSATFSPDGVRLAFTRRGSPDGPSERGLHVLDLATGRIERLTTETFGLSDWASDGFLYGVGSPASSTLVRMRETGGALEEVAAAAGERAIGAIRLPTGSGLIYSATAGFRFGSVVALDLATRETKVLVDQGAFAQWSETGRLIYSRRGGFLEAVPFDPVHLEVTGPPVTVVSGAATVGDFGRFGLSESGTLVYVAGPSIGADEVDRGIAFELMALDGSIERLPATPTDHTDGSISLDGQKIAYIRGGRVWIYDMVRGGDRPLSDEEGADEHNPMWSPDGTRLVFTSMREEVSDEGDLYVQVADGSQPAQRLGGTAGQDAASQWLADGTVLFHSRVGGTGVDGDDDIYRVSPDGAFEQEALLEADWRENTGQVSPDGRWMSYVSAENRGEQDYMLYVRGYPDMLSQTLVSDSELGRSTSTCRGSGPPTARPSITTRADGSGRQTTTILTAASRSRPAATCSTPRDGFSGGSTPRGLAF
jgi:eukaryotic-like serine/threonine-protein kinase